MPNPNPRMLAVEMGGAADGVEMDLWTVAFVLVRQGSGGALQAGWNEVALPAHWIDSVAPGLYYVTVRAHRGQATSLPVKPARILELR